MRRTKILCTLGPASESEEVLAALLDAGMDAVRLNFSHGTAKDHEERVATVRRVAERKKVHLAIVQDIQGPKIRVGDLPGGRIELPTGAEITLVPGERAGPGEIAITYDYLPHDVKAGDPILMDDGYIALRATAVEGRKVVCRVENGGILKSHKGVNFPGVRLSIKFPTEKDRRDLRVGQDLGVDWVAASFVRSAADVARVRADLDDRTRVMAKVELREAVDNLQEIIMASDGVLVARGDLGVELPAEEVPIVQKDMIRRANALGVPVVTATQMLESMITNPRPTRAEASDVANAIFDGTSAIMLSGETAVGKFPVEAVATMSRIAERAERLVLEEAPAPGAPRPRRAGARVAIPEAIGHAAVTSAEELGAKGVVVLTESGMTAALVSKHKPRVPIFALSPHPRTLRQMNLLWGVRPVAIPWAETMHELLDNVRDALVADAGLGPKDVVVLVSGRTGVPGATNHLLAARVGELVKE